MNITNLAPTKLSKFLVGESITVSFNSTDQNLQAELVTNLNHNHQNLPFKHVDQHFTCNLKLKESGFFTYKIRYRLSNGPWKWLKSDSDKTYVGTVQVDPKWLEKAIVYNVFVRFFKGKVAGGEQVNPGEGGTFDDVKAHLDELSHMGINTLYLNPIHLIGELYRKYSLTDHLPAYLQPGSPYSIKDYKSIDPELTYDKDTKKHLLVDPQQELKDLINAAHHKGMYVIMDLVFNHTAHDFVFQRIHPEWFLYKENITSLEDPYLYPEDLKQGKPWGDPKHTMAPFDHGVWWEDAAQLNWEYMIPDGPNPPPPNTSLIQMWDYFKSIPKYWIKHFGVDGFRCDIAYRIPPKFWKACIAESRQLAQKEQNNMAGDVVFIAETYTNDLDKLQKAGFSAVYSDYSHKLSRPLETQGYLEYIYNISDQNFPDGSKWFIFPESHDFGRNPQKIVGDHAGDNPQASFLANKSRWLLTATLPGVPLIFNGFEKIEWQPINLFSYGAVDWEKDSDLRSWISQINHLRHRLIALKKGSYTFLPTNQGLNDHTQLFAFMRTYHHQTIIIVINMDVHQQAGPATIHLPNQFQGAYNLKDLLTDKTYKKSGQDLTVILPPGESHLFLVNN